MFSNAKEKFENLKKLKRMRSQVKNLEKELLQITFTGESKHSHVVCVVDGKLNIKKLEISDELLAKNDKNNLQKHIIDAVQRAIQEAQKGSAAKIQEMGGLSSLGI